MYSTIALSSQQRNALLDSYRSDPDPQLRLRAHIVLLLAAGYTWAVVTAVLFCSRRTIARWKGRFHAGRVEVDDASRRGVEDAVVFLVGAPEGARGELEWARHRPARRSGLMRSPSGAGLDPVIIGSAAPGRQGRTRGFTRAAGRATIRGRRRRRIAGGGDA